MSDPKHPKVGDLHLDATDVKVYDLTKAQIDRKTKLRGGYEAALKIALNLSPYVLRRLGIDPAKRERIQARYTNMLRAEGFLAPGEKFVELMRETIVEEKNHIASFLQEIANAVRKREKQEADGKADPIEPPDDSAPQEEKDAFQKAMEINLSAEAEEILKFQFGPAEQAALTRQQTREKDAKKEEEV